MDCREGEDGGGRFCDGEGLSEDEDRSNEWKVVSCRTPFARPKEV